MSREEDQACKVLAFCLPLSVIVWALVLYLALIFYSNISYALHICSEPIIQIQTCSRLIVEALV